MNNFSLAWLAVRGDAEALRSHLSTLTPEARHAEADGRASCGMTPLAAAAARGHVDCAIEMLRSGATVNLRTSSGMTPLHMAVAVGRSTACTKLLLEAGALLHAFDHQGYSPLFLGCAAGSYSCAELLLEAGVDVDHGTSDGGTPLEVACVNDRTEIVQLLSLHGADRAPPHQRRAVDTARDAGQVDLADWLDRSDGWSPLHHIEQLTTTRTLRLLHGGASLEAVAGLPPCSPLDRAREQPASEVAQLILTAAQPWSVATHHMFPRKARARAVALLRLGYLLASSRFPGEVSAFTDAWLHHAGSVMACAVTRGDGDSGK
jgi:hypothetical protein